MPGRADEDRGASAEEACRVLGAVRLMPGGIYQGVLTGQALTQGIASAHRRRRVAWNLPLWMPQETPDPG